MTHDQIKDIINLIIRQTINTLLPLLKKKSEIRRNMNTIMATGSHLKELYKQLRELKNLDDPMSIRRQHAIEEEIQTTVGSGTNAHELLRQLNEIKQQETKIDANIKSKLNEKPKIEEGSWIECYFHDKWYDGEIRKIHDNNGVLTFDINYDADMKYNGRTLKTEIGVPFDRIRLKIDKSVYEYMHYLFRYMEPITYEAMIQKWEHECGSHQCNYLAVEYPEFAKPGGYQMAINAKPLFIRKALELCAPRGVLYIDGDMFIRKYPALFDMKDVDFMMRGWWIDPRSSYNLQTSITVDPYTFETSGGTMFFAPTPAAKSLIQLWVDESAKPYQQGKADDRILSLVVNSYKLLLGMKYIQLPIEYLWLTLDYDERMLETIYPDDEHSMRRSIIIEHPECLTSEDTATGAGAASNRTPKYYQFIDIGITPVSEDLFESVMFPSKEMANEMRPWLEYLKSATYLNDGNPVLIEKKFVFPNKPKDNAMPFYVTDFDKGLGKRQPIAAANLRKAQELTAPAAAVPAERGGVVEVDGEADIPQILRLLLDGRTVMTTGAGADTKYLRDKMETPAYKTMDWIFTPEHRAESTTFYTQQIDLTQPMLFRPGNNVLIQLLSGFNDLHDLSDYVGYGWYCFLSKIRVGMLFRKAATAAVRGGGGGSNWEKEVAKYLEGQSVMYGAVRGGRRRRTGRRHRRGTRRMQ